MDQSLAQHYLEDSLASFRAYKKLAEKALEQIKDEELFVTLDAESNSIAVIMKHMAGNMLSRWTDFLTSDGEKPDRNRDSEFVIESQTNKADLLAYWEKGWECLFKTLEPLRPDDFARKVLIRGEEHTLVQAINRQLTHYSYHIGQIVFLAKHFRSSDWKTLSIPRNRSAGFNQYLEKKLQAGESEHRFDAAAEFVREKVMPMSIVSLQHVNVRVAPAVEDDAKHFYGTLLGLPEIPKPEEAKARGGAWYQLGAVQLHLSRDAAAANEGSKRHICFHVADLEQTRDHLAEAGVEILPDDQPIPGSPRFYIRDPGGNLMEIAEAQRHGR